MVWPVIAMMAVTAAASAYAAYKKGQISKEEYERLKALGDSARAKMEAPPGTAEPITLEEYAFAQKYNPQLATFVEENRPELVTEAKSQFEISKQREGLNEYSNRAKTGTDVIADAQREEALFEADARDKSRRESILRDMSNRGLSGSGTDLLAQVASSQNAAVGARQASLDATKQAEARRLQALGDMTGLASQVRSQNMQVEQNNANVMNSFNARLANAKNLYNQQVANTQNAAQVANIQNDMAVQNANTGIRNQNRMMDVTRREQAEQQLRDYKNSMAAGDLSQASRLSAMKAGADREFAQDVAQGATGTASAGLATYSAMKAPTKAPAAGVTNNYYGQAPGEQSQLDLDSGEETVENDTNRRPSRTRSMYA